MAKEKDKSNKENKKNRMTLTGFDPVDTPEEIIQSDKDNNRKQAFQEAYKRIAKIIPEYFMTQRKKKNSTSGGSSFQKIVVTEKGATVQATETKVKQENVKEEKERE